MIERHRKYRRIVTIAGLAALVNASLFPIAVSAADEEDTALLAYLGLTAADGKTTTGDGAGELEAYFLMDQLLSLLGTQVRDAVDAKLPGTYGPPASTTNTTSEATTNGTPDPTTNATANATKNPPKMATVIPIANGERLDLRALGVVETRLGIATGIVEELNKDTCTADPASPPDRAGVNGAGEGGVLGTSSIAQAVFGAMKTDTDIKGIAVTNERDLVMDAITSKALDKGKWYIPSERQFSERKLAEQLADLDTEARAMLEKCKKNKNGKAKAEKAIGFLDSLVAPGKDGAPSLLEQAMFLEGLKSDDIYVLRVATGKAGGSMVNRRNIWTSIGVANDLTIRGGLTASWRLVKASSGDVAGSGTIRCATKGVPFRDVHDTTEIGAVCQ